MSAPLGHDEYYKHAGSSYYTRLTIPIAEKELYDVPPSCKEWEVRVGHVIAVRRIHLIQVTRMSEGVKRI